MASFYPHLFRLSAKKEVVVVDILFNSSEAQLATLLLDSPHNVFLSRRAKDKQVWVLESCGKFTSKSFLKLSLAILLPIHLFHIGWFESPQSRQELQNSLGPLYYAKSIRWIYSKEENPICSYPPNGVPYAIRMRKRSIISSYIALKVWNYFISHLGCYWVMPKNLSQLFSSWKSFRANMKSTHFGECLLHAIIWNLW